MHRYSRNLLPCRNALKCTFHSSFLPASPSPNSHPEFAYASLPSPSPPPAASLHHGTHPSPPSRGAGVVCKINGASFASSNHLPTPPPIHAHPPSPLKICCKSIGAADHWCLFCRRDVAVRLFVRSAVQACTRRRWTWNMVFVQEIKDTSACTISEEWVSEFCLPGTVYVCQR